MILIIYNKSSGQRSYLSSTVLIAQSANYTVTSSQIFQISRDAQLVADCNYGNVLLSDGINEYIYGDALKYLEAVANSVFPVYIGLGDNGVYGSLALTTANIAYEAKVGVSKLSNRKFLTITALDNIYWGYDNAVTTSTGTPLYKNQQILFSINPYGTFQVWLVASANSKTARITESS